MIKDREEVYDQADTREPQCCMWITFRKSGEGEHQPWLHISKRLQKRFGISPMQYRRNEEP